MTAAEQEANELISIFKHKVNGSMAGNLAHNLAKQCALITVGKIIDSNSDFAYSGNIWADNKSYSDSEIYWLEVKTAIENSTPTNDE